MNKLSAIFFIFALVSCTTEELLDVPTDIQPAPEVEKVTEYHEKIRTKPYPLAESTIFVNPAPLIVPQSMKTGATLQFQLSPDPTFQSPSTITSAPQQWCMFSPHKVLEAGQWYWRFRNDEGQWSEPYEFAITGDEPLFATPAFDVFLANAPRRHPRLNCYIDAAAELYRETAPSHPEFRSMTARANGALNLSTDDTDNLYSDYATLMNSVTWLSDAYILTGNEPYAAKLLSLLEAMTGTPATDGQLFSDNFATSAITYAYTAIYDLLYNRLPEPLRQAAEQQMMRTLVRFTEANMGYQENHIFDNHFWQQNMRMMFQTAFVLFDNPAYADQVRTYLQYFYELWCTRAPATGFSRDGLWHNGVGYMSANITTLAYMPKLLSYVTRFDFLSHPWYREAGRSLCYSCPTGSMGVGFGDQSEKYTTTNRQYPAFADFLASETGDEFAGWYARQNSALLRNDYELRLYRMTRLSDSYPVELPSDASNMSVYMDAGEVAMHSNISDTPTDLALAFRSSGFGSGSHTTASQNAFNLYYGGNPVFHSSGYYQNFSDAHNLMSYRHSRAHNTILVNGIGQPYTTRAYGALVRAGGGSSVCYALGDASHAYCGVSDDPLWLKAFADAWITQTPDNGFGPTPLTRYRRHIAMLQGGIVVLYDELEASEPARWDWLLHSATPFTIDAAARTIEVTSASSKSRVMLLSGAASELSQTNDFAVPPAVQGPQYPDQWHFTAVFGYLDKVRVLAVIQTADLKDDLKPMTRTAAGVTVGNWTISAALDGAVPPSLAIVNSRNSTGLSYGNEPFLIGGNSYPRSYSNSTIIVDKAGGVTNVSELVDRTPANSRSVY